MDMHSLTSTRDKFQQADLLNRRKDPHTHWKISAIVAYQTSLNHTSQTFLSFIIPFTGTYEANKLSCSHLSGFIAPLVRALHRHRRGHGFESVEDTRNFSGVHNRWDCPVSVRIISSIHLSTTLHKHFFKAYLTYICLRQYETTPLTSPISTQADLSSCVMDSSTSPERNLFTDSFSVSSSS